MNKTLNRRRFKRYKFDKPVKSSLELVTISYQNENQNIETKDIYIVDMSAGGLRFVSKVEFAVNFLAIYKVHLKLHNREIVLFGKIVRKQKLVKHFFDYGFRFEFNYGEHFK
ncbi:PilZ domain-containing protein [Neobacillus citreus]|uniref:PilZ domain-containing protein n=1 Tax=Neobacillus citreus TaxID=2833578 RepID=A0A942SV18_9BACI|nr:PilZ domain-containing protein [Neobacillus citreus]MCH6263913.1 PilZ domain-containing protein [Neobacillus citreus]